jgi:hypothetical protein
MSNTELAVESLAARMNRQGQSIYRLWAALAAFAVLAALAIFVIVYREMPRSDTLRAATLNADTVIAGTVSLRNATGEIVALLSSSSDGAPQISLFDRQKKLRVSIALRANGGPSISLLDPDLGPRAVLSLNDRQEPSLAMSNEPKGPRRALLGVDPSGSGFLGLYGTGGGLNLFGSDGRVRWNPVAGTAQDLPVQEVK